MKRRAREPTCLSTRRHRSEAKMEARGEMEPFDLSGIPLELQMLVAEKLTVLEQCTLRTTCSDMNHFFTKNGEVTGAPITIEISHKTFYIDVATEKDYWARRIDADELKSFKIHKLTVRSFCPRFDDHQKGEILKALEKEKGIFQFEWYHDDEELFFRILDLKPISVIGDIPQTRFLQAYPLPQPLWSSFSGFIGVRFCWPPFFSAPIFLKLIEEFKTGVDTGVCTFISIIGPLGKFPFPNIGDNLGRPHFVQSLPISWEENDRMRRFNLGDDCCSFHKQRSPAFLVKLFKVTNNVGKSMAVAVNVRDFGFCGYYMAIVTDYNAFPQYFSSIGP